MGEREERQAAFNLKTGCHGAASRARKIEQLCNLLSSTVKEAETPSYSGKYAFTTGDLQVLGGVCSAIISEGRGLARAVGAIAEAVPGLGEATE